MNLKTCAAHIVSDGSSDGSEDMVGAVHAPTFVRGRLYHVPKMGTDITLKHNSNALEASSVGSSACLDIQIIDLGFRVHA